MNIDKIRLNGEIRALKQTLDTLQFDLTSRNWSGITKSDKYVRMGEAIENAEEMLYDMKAVLETLQTLEPDNY